MPLALHRIYIAVHLQRGEPSGPHWEVAERDSGQLSVRMSGLLGSAAGKP